MKEKNKNKKKINIKKVFLRIKKVVVKAIKEILNKINALPSYVKKISLLWIVIVVIILILIFATNANNKFIAKYENLEKEMNTGALDYVESNNLYPLKGNKLKLDLDLLLEYNYVYDEHVVDDSCKGFSVVYYDDFKEEYVINSYLNCENYTTDEYYDYK